MSKAADAAKNALAKKNGTGGKTPLTLAGLKSTQVNGILKRYEAQLLNVLPKHVSAERMLQVATTLVMQNPDIANCTTQSLIGGLLAAGILGLEPTPQLGLCYFVPFKRKIKENGKEYYQKEIQFIIGYRGMVQLARNSGQVETVYAQAVYGNDEFSYQFGLNPDIKHVPSTGDRGALTHVYAVMKYKGGGFNFEVMSKRDVDKIMSRSQSSGSSYSPWKTDYDAMAKKTVVRQLFKMAPVSVEVQKQIALDSGRFDANTIKTAGDVSALNAEYDEADVVSVEDVPEDIDQETGEVTEDLSIQDMMIALGELSKKADKLSSKAQKDFEAWSNSPAQKPEEIEYWYNTLSNLK